MADLDREDGSFPGPDFTGHCGFDRKALGAQMAAVSFRDVAFSTCYAMRKPTDQEIREYPLFLAGRGDPSGSVAAGRLAILTDTSTVEQAMADYQAGCF